VTESKLCSRPSEGDSRMRVLQLFIDDDGKSDVDANHILPPTAPWRRAMITFSVVRERHGWAIRMGERMTTPFWSKDAAIREADRRAGAIRRHGEIAEVIVEGPGLDQPFLPLEGSTSTGADAPSPSRWNGWKRHGRAGST